MQKEIEDDTGVKFGVLQLGLFSGMVFEEIRTEETPLTEQQATMLISHLASEGFIKTEAPTPEVAELPQELEAAKTKAVELIARDGGITPAAITELTAQKTVVVQSTISYDNAQTLLTHFEERGYAIHPAPSEAEQGSCCLLSCQGGRSYSAKSKPCPAETISCPAGALPFSNEFCILIPTELPEPQEPRD